jgi:glycosyltransferase involved in cell wall biosynthesis
MKKISNHPLVSVIIPSYNHQFFVERCLNSVAAQTYENIEVVIVDDCSPDDSADRIDRLIQTSAWKSRFPERTKFHCFSVNQGAHAAINHAISEANGEIISILNSDDMYYPNRLASIIREMQDKDQEMVFSRVQYIDENDDIITHAHPVGQKYFQNQELIKQFPTLGFACLLFNVAISTGNFVFTKSVFDQVGPFNGYRYCHDWDFLLRSLIYTEPHFLDQSLYYYRFHGKNTFESLESVGVAETNQILSGLISNLNFSNTLNPLAPSPLNWPNYFELFLYWFNLERYIAIPNGL